MVLVVLMASDGVGPVPEAGPVQRPKCLSHPTTWAIPCPLQHPPAVALCTAVPRTGATAAHAWGGGAGRGRCHSAWKAVVGLLLDQGMFWKSEFPLKATAEGCCCRCHCHISRGVIFLGCQPAVVGEGAMWAPERNVIV